MIRQTGEREGQPARSRHERDDIGIQDRKRRPVELDRAIDESLGIGRDAQRRLASDAQREPTNAGRRTQTADLVQGRDDRLSRADARLIESGANIDGFSPGECEHERVVPVTDQLRGPLDHAWRRSPFDDRDIGQVQDPKTGAKVRLVGNVDINPNDPQHQFFAPRVKSFAGAKGVARQDERRQTFRFIEDDGRRHARLQTNDRFARRPWRTTDQRQAGRSRFEAEPGARGRRPR